MIAASTDDAETKKRVADSLEADYPILNDPHKKAAEAHGVLVPERGVARRWTDYIGKDGTPPRRQWSVRRAPWVD
jgi:peroxiredoxin